MKLIVGLGNPGVEYSNTRHNVGFMILDNYLINEKWNKKDNYEIIEKRLFNEKVIFLKPLSYMNLSGKVVANIVRFYKISTENILVIQDDISIAVGEYKIKKNSSSGGHNGIKSIIEELGTDSFSRLKIGIGNQQNIPLDSYVLGKLNLNDKNLIVNNYTKYNEIINCFIEKNVEETMCKFNHKMVSKNEL